MRELAEAGLGGLEVYYRSFDAATVVRRRRGRGRARARRDRRQRLPRRHEHVRRGARRPVGPARGGRWHPRRGRREARRHSHDRSIDPRPAPCRCSSSCPPRRRRARVARPRPTTSASPSTVPEARTLPRFHVWTLGCQMNRSDSEEMAGRLLAAGCDEAPTPRGGRPRRHQHLRDPRGRRAEGHRPAGPAGPAQGREPGAARRADRLLGPRAGPGRAPAPLPGGRPVPAARRGARARRPAGPRLRAGADRAARRARRRPSGGPSSAPPTTCPATRARAVGQGTVARGSAIAAWLPIIYGCDKTCTYCIVPFSRGPGAEPAVRRHRRRGARAGRGRLSRGHAARPERQLVRPRPAARAALRARRRRRAGRAAGSTSTGRPDLAELIRAIDGCGPPTAAPAIGAAAVRHLAPVGPVGPADRGDGRVRVGLRAPPPAGPVGRRRGAPADGPPVHDRALPRAADADPRGGARASRSRPTSSSASAARPRPSSRRRCALLETVRYDQVFAAAYSPRPGTPAHAARRRRAGRRQAPPAQRAARAPGGDRPRAQRGVARPRGRGPRRRGPAAARTATSTTPTATGGRSRAPARAGCPAGRAATSSSTSPGDAALVGREVLVRIDHAGPYALRGALVGA